MSTISALFTSTSRRMLSNNTYSLVLIMVIGLASEILGCKQAKSGVDGDDTSSEHGDVDTDTDTDTVNDTDVDVDTDAPVETDADADNDTDTDTDTNTDTNTDVDNDSDADTDIYHPSTCVGEDIFVDAVLEEYVRSLISWNLYGESTVYQGELTEELLSQITGIDLPRKDPPLERLDGIECLVNLDRVSLTENDISDLRPLAGLSHLNKLSLAQNRIDNLAPLNGLKGLTFLSIANNSVTDLSPLVGLENLDWLVASDNLIEEVSPLASLPRLENLVLSRNPLVNPEVLASAPGLKILELEECGISTIEWMSAFSQGQLIDFNGARNQITDLSPLSAVTSLKYLNLSYNEVENATVLAPLSQLESLYLEGNLIADISFLNNLSSIGSLGLAENRIVDITPLNSLTSLTEICHPSWESSEVPICLTEIDLHGNLISDITPLRAIVERNHEISHKAPAVDLSENRIEDIYQLAGLFIHRLDASNNLIHDAGALIDTPVLGLNGLNLVNNRIESLSFLRMIEIPGAIVSTYYQFFMGNPLDETAVGFEIPRACDADVPVYWGEGEWCDFIESPESLPEWSADPTPYTGAETALESCGVDRIWLADGGLPGLAHNGSVFTTSEPVAGDPVVADSVTGLTWRRCSAGQIWDGTSCAGAVPALTREEAAAECALSYAGEGDWRLPDATELVSLVDYSIAGPGPVLDAAAFPATLSGQYWGSAVSPRGSAVSWQVNFYNGALEAGLEAAAVRCVRGGGTGDVATRFAVSTDGTVNDTWTGLIWQRCAVGQSVTAEGCDVTGMRLQEAAADTACTGTFAGSSNWRLPNIDELASLVNHCAHDAAISHTAFPGSPRDAFWTATPLAGDTKRWWVDMSWGALLFDEPANLNGFVRCVRSP